jgi:outer membrane protein OmpA-like peptidoglycan-associated protein
MTTSEITRRLRPAVAPVTLLAALAAAGCGGSGSGDAAPGEKPEARTTTPAATTTTSTTPTPEGLRSVEMLTGPSRYRITVRSVRRSGPFLTLNLAFSCVRGDTDCSSEFDFSQAGPNTQDLNTMAAVRLLEPGSAKEYAVVRDGDERPYASAIEPSYSPGPRRYRAWLRFAAPPAGVKTIDLALPDGGPHVDDLPITEGGGVDPNPSGSGEVGASPAPFDRPPESASADGLDLGVSDLKLEVRSRGGDERISERAGRRTVTLAADVLFAFDRASLGDGADGLLGDTADTIDARADGPVAVDGYTDSKGADAYNLRLSERRAQTVSDALSRRLGSEHALRAAGHGEADPVAPNTTDSGEDNPAGRRRNRRVTIGFSVRAPAASSTSEEEAPTPPAPDAGPPVRSVRYTTGEAEDGTNLRVDVDGIRRRGAMAVLDLRVTCERSELDDCHSQFLLAEDPMGLGPLDAVQFSNTAGAISLVDPAADATYLAARNPDSFPFAAGVVLVPGRTSFPLWVYFAAPPPSVKTMTVAMPSGGPRLTGIPVE